MFRFFIEWVLTQCVDDNRKPGPVLSWFLRHDVMLREFHADLLELKRRLSHDAAELLAETASSRKRTLTVLNRCWQRDSRRASRRTIGRTLGIASLSVLIFFGAAFMVSVLMPTHLPQGCVLADSVEPCEPLIADELIRLPRTGADDLLNPGF